MAITDYSFGRIRIDDKEYISDVIITPDGIKSPWWRKEGHRLDTADLSEVMATPPRILVIGTGYYGRMTVPKETLDALHARGIETRVGRTREAVKEFNRLQREMAQVVAALHLTC